MQLDLQKENIGQLRLPMNHPTRRAELELQNPASQSVKQYVNQLMQDYLSPICDKIQSFEKVQTQTEYKVSDIIKMLSLVQNFANTYDQEAFQTRDQITQLQKDQGESKVLGNCLEQKVHYMEREIAKFTSYMNEKFASAPQLLCQNITTDRFDNAYQ